MLFMKPTVEHSKIALMIVMSLSSIEIRNNIVFTCPDSSVYRAFAFGGGFMPLLPHTKGDKNGTGSFLPDVHNKKGSARKKQKGK